ncbi:hypothetical protein Q1695_006049 [Nippostrongylus brasiliensis]|nr:hypothetical protein Q1695_006049 [Nippostrongylus brasiliensis]
MRPRFRGSTPRFRARATPVLRQFTSANIRACTLLIVYFIAQNPARLVVLVRKFVFCIINRYVASTRNVAIAVPYPDPPEQVLVNAVEHDKLSVCWKPPMVHDSNKDFPCCRLHCLLQRNS